jgi:hypothetical protein
VLNKKVQFLCSDFHPTLPFVIHNSSAGLTFALVVLPHLPSLDWGLLLGVPLDIAVVVVRFQLRGVVPLHLADFYFRIVSRRLTSLISRFDS